MEAITVLLNFPAVAPAELNSASILISASAVGVSVELADVLRENSFWNKFCSDMVNLLEIFTH
jgi:hypothetical protein